MAKKFTDTQIKALKPKNKRYPLYDAGSKGFGIRVEPTGRKTFFFEYRFGGRNRIMTLGKYPTITLSMARSQAAQAREKVERDVDPGLERSIKKHTDRNAFTVKELACEYMERHAKPNKKSWEKDQGMLNRDVIPALGSKKAKDISRGNVVALIDKIRDRKAPAMANRVQSLVSNIFKFAVQRDILDSSPCVYLAKPQGEKPRERFLSKKEIKQFWEGLMKGGVTLKLRLALQLILVTSQRPGEVASAEWNEFDLENRWWTIPTTKTKNKKEHRVPLSYMALELLKEIKDNWGDSKYLFPARLSTWQTKHTARASLSDTIRNNWNSFNIEEHFRPHDLRRTAASQMTSIDIPRLTVSKILNHAEGGTTAIYDRNSYDKEKQKALEAWSRKLESIISGEPSGKIVEMKKR
jgi:integrase